MHWTSLLILIALVIVFMLLRRRGQLTTLAAQQLLREGAAVVDVRTQGEFATGHLPKAINIPLDRIEADLPGRFTDRDQTLLLHCQSGMRSGMAVSKLRALGYTRVFNLGGYARAKSVIRG